MARTKKLTPEQEKEIALLRANNEMLEKTKEETKLRGNEDAVKSIQSAQDDVIAQIAQIDEGLAEEARRNPIPKHKRTNKVRKEIQLNQDVEDESVYQMLNTLKQSENAVQSVQTVSVKEDTPIEVKEPQIEEKVVKNESLNMNMDAFNEIPSDIQYDVISLPSNGECYSNKIGRLPVGYLTAYDENFLTSPNLYQDGLVIDFLLKNKVLDKSFDVNNLCNGDVDAIILFLRATSYGPEFPVSVRDPKSGTRFDAVADLTTFKTKEFRLQGDENGWFEYVLPLSKDVIKFKYLTRREEKNLELISKLENKRGISSVIESAEVNLKMALDEDKVLSKEEKNELDAALQKISNWKDKVSVSDNTYVSKLITNRMEMQIMSVNGNTDKHDIYQYIKKMPIRDSFELRKYITDNEPGIDWSMTVEVPESLGGGSVKTFLNWDDAVFLNIAEG